MYRFQNSWLKYKGLTFLVANQEVSDICHAKLCSERKTNYNFKNRHSQTLVPVKTQEKPVQLKHNQIYKYKHKCIVFPRTCHFLQNYEIVWKMKYLVNWVNIIFSCNYSEFICILKKHQMQQFVIEHMLNILIIHRS